MKKTFSISVVFVVTALALAYSLWGADFESLQSSLSGGDYASFGPFLAVLATIFILKAHRWSVILSPLGGYSWRAVFPAMMIGFAGNNVLPAHLGEVVRVVVFSRQYSKPMSGVFVSLIVERGLDVIAILLILALAVTGLDVDLDLLWLGAWLAAAMTGIAALVIFACLKWPSLPLALWSRVCPRLPPLIARKGEWILENSVLALSALRSPLSLLYLLFNSLAQWLLVGILAWLAVRSFGVEQPPAVAFLLASATALAVAMPSAPGYVGAIQAAFVLVLSHFAVAQELALAASIYFLLGQWIPITIAGLICFLFVGLGFSETRQAVRAATHE